MTGARLGRARLQVPALALGGGPLGNYLRAISDAEALATVETAWQHGVRFFDTAPFYGAGLAERRLGEALLGRPRDEYVLSTKVGRLVEPGGQVGAPALFDVPPTHHCTWDFSRDGVRRSLDDSLTRLGVDRVDLLLIHDPYDHWQDAVELAFPALAELRDAGVVGAIGVGMGDAAMLTDFVRYTDIDMVMVSGRYTVVDRSAAEALLPLCLERGVWAVSVSVFTTGLLVENHSAGAVPDPHRDRARRVVELCRDYDVPVAAVAMQFPLRHRAVAAVAVGCHTPEQVKDDIDAMDHPVPPQLWAALTADWPRSA